MTLKELEPQLLQLTNQEKAQVIQILSQSLANCPSNSRSVPQLEQNRLVSGL